jgi:hypothetical protein
MHRTFAVPGHPRHLNDEDFLDGQTVVGRVVSNDHSRLLCGTKRKNLARGMKVTILDLKLCFVTVQFRASRMALATVEALDTGANAQPLILPANF